MTIQEKQQDIIDEFSVFDDWMDKYSYIIELGAEMPALDSKYQTEDNLIKGCQSKVWFHADYIDGKIVFEADSDAIITKGIAAILVRVFSNETPKDIIDADLNFIDVLGLKQHLSPTRSNGLLSMLKQVKIYALAFSNK
ncbi:MAG: SufE family protein [Marinifilaceae bacterium]|jgi:cysteine desulfuration protein SufE|nr:SufE family protein [Marinifilaceae bacterium]